MPSAGLAASFVAMGLSAAALAACNQGGDSNPSSQTAPPTPSGVAAAQARPPQAPPPSRPSGGAPASALVRQADALDQRLAAQGASVASFAFNHAGSAAQAWRDPTLGQRVAAGPRTYYFRRGEAEPYLVVEKRYAYGYAKGVPTEMLDSQGRPLGKAEADRRRADARAALAEGAVLSREAADQIRAPPPAPTPEPREPGRRSDRLDDSGAGGART